MHDSGLSGDGEPIELAHAPAIRIGAVEIRPATREVARDDRSEVIEPRVMQVLVALARAKGVILTRDDLTRLCWDGRIVGEDAINRVISRLRTLARTFGAFRIETINKVGYRLVEDEAPPQRWTARAMSSPAKVERRGLIGGGLALGALVAGGAWIGLSSREASATDDLIRRGREALRLGTPDHASNAIALFRLATETEPDNAEAWGALSLAYRELGMFGAFDEAALAERSRAAARRAQELDPDNGDAAATMVLLTPMARNWQAFEARCREALRNHPDHPALLGSLAHVHGQTGRMAAAVPILARAMEVEPARPMRHQFYASALWNSGRIDEAEAVLDRALEQWPRFYALWFTRLYLYAFTGKTEAALALAQDRQARPIGIPEWNFEMTIAAIRAVLTRAPADVERAMTWLMDAARRGAGFAENAAIFGAVLGRIDQSFTALSAYFFDEGFEVSELRFTAEQAVRTPKRRRNTHFLFYRTMAPVRADPRFNVLVERLGLEDFWRKSGTVPDYRHLRP